MIETDDGRMLFEPGLIEVQPDETVRFVISNDGMIEHEFVFNTTVEIIAHKDEMMTEAAHDMPHDSDNAITLQPGEIPGEPVGVKRLQNFNRDCFDVLARHAAKQQTRRNTIGYQEVPTSYLETILYLVRKVARI